MVQAPWVIICFIGLFVCHVEISQITMSLVVLLVLLESPKRVVEGLANSFEISFIPFLLEEVDLKI
jgi:hypothetical protein